MKHGLRRIVKHPPDRVLSCRCGHLVAVHNRRGRCDTCKCVKPKPDMATYPLGQTVVTS